MRRTTEKYSYRQRVPSTPSAARSNGGPAKMTRARTIGTRTRADTILNSMGSEPAVSSVSPLELNDGLEQVLTAKIGPEGGCDVNLGIGNLPEKEVADPHFAARPNQQVRIRN